jgi:hypothetical protein
LRRPGEQENPKEAAVITTTCPHCHTEQTLGVRAVILARHLPTGDGAITYHCMSCRTPVCLLLTWEEVMHAVFAGARAIDIETVP